MATFIYCLLLLRTIRAHNETDAAFIPHLSLVFALVLTVASVAVLIYFIHHITESLHVSNVVGNVARDLDAAIEDYTAASAEAAGKPLARLPANFDETAVAVTADSHGYTRTSSTPACCARPPRTISCCASNARPATSWPTARRCSGPDPPHGWTTTWPPR